MSRCFSLPRRLPNSYDPPRWKRTRVQTARLHVAVPFWPNHPWAPYKTCVPPALAALPFRSLHALAKSQAFQLSSLLAYPPCCGCEKKYPVCYKGAKKKKFPCAGTLYCTAPQQRISAVQRCRCRATTPVHFLRARKTSRVEPEISIADSGSGLILEVFPALRAPSPDVVLRISFHASPVFSLLILLLFASSFLALQSPSSGGWNRTGASCGVYQKRPSRPSGGLAGVDFKSNHPGYRAR